MTFSSAGDVVGAVRAFVAKMDGLEPGAGAIGSIEIRAGDDHARLAISAPVARALIEALANHHDPRDRGPCDHCGGHRVDGNFLCLDCGRPSGLFGQMLVERAARHGDGPARELRG